MSFNILFLTNFDEASHQAIPAAAHLLSEIQSTLTIMHVYQDAMQRDDAERDVHSFFAEAEHYPNCRRIAMQGDLESTAAQYCAAAKIDLVMAPSVKRLWLRRPFRNSNRGGLMNRIPAPLWTMTARANAKAQAAPIKRVACYVDFSTNNLNQVHAAVLMARQLRAKLQLLCVTPPTSEATMLRVLDPKLPLHSREAERRLEALIHSLSADAEIFVETGDDTAQIVDLVKRAKCDILFLGEGNALTRNLAGKPVLRSLVTKLPCPAICLDGASRHSGRWSMEPRHVEHLLDMRLSLRGVPETRKVG